MTALTFLAAAATAGASGAPTRLDPLKLFTDADIVVQLVMGGLILASLWVWATIFTFLLRASRLDARNRDYEGDFWKAADINAYHAEHGKDDAPSARVAGAGLSEWRRSLAGKRIDREGVRQRLALAMSSAVEAEADSLARRLNILATVGSVAPFVGLFGTVWGIMNSFFQIGKQQNSSLAVVAPGISEALFATAIGLFAAIPAVIAYNRLGARVNLFEGRLQRFADLFHMTLSPLLEAE